MRRARRTPRRGRARERRLDVSEQPDERVDLGAGQAFEEAPEPVLQQHPAGRERRAAGLGELERLAAAVVGQPLPLEQPGRFEPAGEL